MIENAPSPRIFHTIDDAVDVELRDLSMFILHRLMHISVKLRHQIGTTPNLIKRMIAALSTKVGDRTIRDLAGTSLVMLCQEAECRKELKNFNRDLSILAASDPSIEHFVVLIKKTPNAYC